MAAASVSVSVKFAMIRPALAVTGVTIAPASPPVPRLSVLPAPIDVAPGELTTPPSATVSVPTGLQPQLLAPIASELNAFKTEPAPVTITFELPSYASPMIVDVVELTTPPLAMVSAPGPTEPSPTKRPKGAADVPGRAGSGHGRGRSAEERKEGGDVRAALAVERAAVADGDGRRGEIADDRLPGDGHARARSGDHCAAGNAEIGGRERAAVGDGKRSALDDRRAADGERAAADRQRRARACAAEREIAADDADVAAVAGAGQRQRSHVVELERARPRERARERAAAVAYDA